MECMGARNREESGGAVGMWVPVVSMLRGWTTMCTLKYFQMAEKTCAEGGGTR